MFGKTATLVFCCLAALSQFGLSQELGPTSNVNQAVFVDPNSVGPTVKLASFEDSKPNPPAATSGVANNSPLVRIDSLPNTAGQVWRQYDLRSYTQPISTTKNPQQAILDWVLRETGTELWFNEPLGVLSATREQLYVYHTPEIQGVVEKIVDRFLRSGGQPQVVGVRLMTVGNPNWRAGSYSMMQPIDVQSPGIEGWMLTKENAALLVNQLHRRTDYVEHGVGDFTAHAGQKIVINRTRPIDFTRAVRWVQGRFPPYETLVTRIDEGYTMDISSLASSDGTIEALLRCNVDQVERLQQVEIDVPDNSGGMQSVRIGVPQMVSWKLHERFRWPSDQVLLLSCGVVANPSEDSGSGLGLQNLFSRSRGRADALLMLEYKGSPRQTTPPRTAAQSPLVPVQPVR